MSEEEILTTARLVEENTALTAERDSLAAELKISRNVTNGLIAKDLDSSAVARKRCDSLRAALLAVEWGGTTNAGFCPHCELVGEHAPDCIVGLALGGAK